MWVHNRALDGDQDWANPFAAARGDNIGDAAFAKLLSVSFYAITSSLSTACLTSEVACMV